MPRKSTLKLSRRVVEALAVERGDRVFYDRDLTGFGVRVHASGRKVYVVHARAPGGALKRAAIGRKVDITVEDERELGLGIDAETVRDELEVATYVPAGVQFGHMFDDASGDFIGVWQVFPVQVSVQKAQHVCAGPHGLGSEGVALELPALVD